MALALLMAGAAQAQTPGAPRFERIGSEHGLSHSCVLTILQDRDGFLWLGTLDGLNRYDGVEFVILRHRPHDRGSLSNNIVRALHEDRAGRLWVGTESGVDRLDDSRTRAIRYRLAAGGEDEEPVVRDFLEARDGTLWLGTSLGLFRHLPASDRFELWAALRGEGVSAVPLPHAEVLRLQEDDSALWVLTGDAKADPTNASLSRLVPERGETSDFPLATAGRQIYDFLIDRDGTMWIDAGFDPPSGVFRGDLRTGRLAATPVWALYEDAAGTLWVGSESGLGQAEPMPRPGLGERRSDPRDAGWLGGFVLAIHQDSAGALWLGTLGGLYRSEPTVKPFSNIRHVPGDGQSLGVDAVSAIAESAAPPSGRRLWVATFGGGVDVLDPGLRHVGRFRHDPADPGSLCDDLVWSLLLDDRREPARLWLGTESGLCSLDLETQQGSRHHLPTSGLTVFDPRQVVDDPFVPPVVITRIETAGRQGTVEMPARGLHRLVLAPGQTTVTFEFAAISFTNAGENRYVYRLEDFDDDWIDAGTRRLARYTNLPPDDYVFRVRGSNHDDVWNETGAALPITVRPTMWQATWFRLAAALTALFLAIFAYRYRVRSLLAVERLRVRIAGDLHDDLSSELSAIALVADVMERQPDLGERDRSRLSEMRLRALTMVDSLRDIVWYVNPEHDNQEATVRRARSLARSLLPDVDLRFEADVSTARRISMSERREIYLLLKEALHNVARHARAQVVDVVIEIDARALHLLVRDDGRGFDTARVGDGNGLRNLQTRAYRLGAELRVDSAPGRGTVVELRTPRAAAWRGFGMAGDEPEA